MVIGALALPRSPAGRFRRWSRFRLIGGIITATILTGACNSGPDPRVDQVVLIEQAECSLGDGDYPAAFEVASRGKEAWRENPESPWFWRFQLLEAEVEYHRGDFAESLKLLDEEPPTGERFGEVQARRKMLQANAYRRDREYEKASALLDEAQQLAAKSGSTALQLPILVRRGLLLRETGDSQQADQLMRQVLDLARSRDDVYHQSLALLNLGFFRFRSQHFHEAVSFFEEMLRLSDGKTCLGVPRTLAQSNLAASYGQLGVYDAARRISLRAIERLKGTQDRLNLERAYGLLGNLYYNEGRYQEAAEAYRAALKGAKEADLLQDEVLWAGNLTSALISLPDWDSAEEANRESRLYLDALSEPPTLYLLNQGRIDDGRGQVASAEKSFLEVLKMPGQPALHWQADVGLGQLYRKLGSYEKSNRSFEEALRIIRERRSELYEKRPRPGSELDKIAYISRLIRFHQDYVDSLVAQGREVQALAVAESSRALLLQQSLQLEKEATDSSTDGETFRETARKLDAVILSYWLAPKGSFLWIVSSQGIWCVPLPEAAKIESRVRSYAELVARKEDTRSSSWARQLYEMLIQPAQQHLRSVKRVVVIPDGALHGLNFETLPVPGQAPRYWLEEVEVAVAPSLRLLSGELRSRSGSARLLLISAPRPVEGFPALEYARDEAQGILRHFSQATSLSGDEARPQAYLQSHPEQYSILHFATHAEANRISPLDSAVILSPPPEAPEAFRLHVRDILQVPLPNTELVTLSACDSAGSRAFAGEGQVGLAWAFLHQGARRVIAGLWKVNDRTSARLMEALYQGIAEGETPHEALTEAKRGILRQGGRYSAPYYWAAFQLYRR